MQLIRLRLIWRRQKLRFVLCKASLNSRTANVEYTKSQHARYANLQKRGRCFPIPIWMPERTTHLPRKRSVMQRSSRSKRRKMTIQKYERSHKQALSSWRAQKEQLKYYEIVAPIAGTTWRHPVKQGDHVTSETALTTLTENHPLEVYISIPAEKASLMQKGMQVDHLRPPMEQTIKAANH